MTALWLVPGGLLVLIPVLAVVAVFQTRADERESLRAWVGRHAGWWWAVAGLVLGVLAGLALWWWLWR